MRLGSSGFRRSGAAAGVALLALLISACGGGPGAASGAEAGAGTRAPTVRLGYSANLTHATALVGVESGIFQDALGPSPLDAKVFGAGPAAVEALFSGAVDAAYLGPIPAVNAHVQSRGEAIRIVSGATSGGALLVVRPGIDGPADLAGGKVASPQRGASQDVALRHWLEAHGLETDLQGGGDVSVVPQDNARTLETFRAGEVDGGWVPEPWATRLVQEGGGKVLVDERTLWPEGRFVTTHLAVRARFLEEHPDAVRRLVEGQVRANDLLNTDPAGGRHLVDRAFARITGRGIADAVLRAAWENLEFTNDPIAPSLAVAADHATEVGVLDPVSLDGIYDLTILNQALRTAERPEVSG